VTVLAILHLVGGALGLMGTLCGGAAQVAGPQALMVGPPSPLQDFQKRLAQHLEDIPGQKTVTWGSLGLSLVLDVMLLSGGVGLLGMRPWARTLSLVYAVLSILNRVFTSVWTLAIVLPATSEFLEQNMGQYPGTRAAAVGGKIGGIVGVVVNALFIAYPITVLIILNLRSVRAAFRGEEAVGLPADLEDEGWGAIRRPGLTTDVTTEPDPDRDLFQPPDA
jgi:hypothetical protein